MARDDRAPTYKLANLASFQHFDPGGAYELALYLGKQCGEMGDQDAADKWFQVAASNASGKHPPNPDYVERVVQAYRSTAAALMATADKVAREMEQIQVAKRNALAANERKRAEKDGQKSATG